ncbi:MAG: hypothetical protein E6868_22510 [Pantoea sp.]|uniref:hypothetical protein n=1 Tax=Pantoea sp. TaxID=69393 RepID=UPI0029045A45|nr:hypothetical protein [Pantoea sp.]MDU1575993.1 hypothetical protein [Pantoea sp.]
MLKNETFNNFRCRSFFIEKELICQILVLFFKTSSSGWMSLTIDEGVSKLSREPCEPSLLDIKKIDDEFAYPVQDVKDLTCYIGKKILNTYEYRINKIEEGCIGVYFDCGDCGFSVLEVDGCLSIIHGVSDDLQNDISLIKL